MTAIQRRHPLAMLGQHLIRQAVEALSGGIHLAEARVGLRHAGEPLHLLAQGGELRLLRLELAGQRRQLGRVFTGSVGQHPAVAVLQRPREPGDGDH
ncbi:hypothetical protein D3C78_1814650 [compost metagenome]